MGFWERGVVSGKVLKGRFQIWDNFFQGQDFWCELLKFFFILDIEENGKCQFKNYYQLSVVKEILFYY